MDINPSDVKEIKKKLDLLMEEALEAASRNSKFNLKQRGKELGLDDAAILSARKVLDRIDRV